MKILQLIIIPVILTLNLYSQEIKRVNTVDLIPIAEKFGLDSAINLSRNYPIFRIDSTTALELVKNITSYSKWTTSSYFLFDMTHNWNNQQLNNKIEAFTIKQLNEINETTLKEYNSLTEVDNNLIVSLAINNLNNLEPLLIETYLHNSSLADTLKDNFPPRLLIFYKSFNHKVFPIIDAYQICQLNCYKIMWLLGELENDFFDEKKLNFHNTELTPYLQNMDIYDIVNEYKEYETRDLDLINDYSTLNDLDFNVEPALKGLIVNYQNDNSWIFILQHDKKGYLDLGCLYMAEEGFGIKYKIELIKSNKLRISIIESWRA